jgi:transcriptional regulator with XRE-family HTH domain
MSNSTPRKVNSMIARKLAAAIAAQEKSRYRLAQETGISQGTLSELMSGTRALSLDNAERLAAAMGLEFRLVPIGQGVPVE